MTYYTINPYLKEVTQTFEKINPHLYHKRNIYIIITISICMGEWVNG